VDDAITKSLRTARSVIRNIFIFPGAIQVVACLAGLINLSLKRTRGLHQISTPFCVMSPNFTCHWIRRVSPVRKPAGHMST
jgi:hypothetical protein